MFNKTSVTILLLISSAICVQSWDTEELEIFDLVEEIKVNFYELMGIQQVNRVNLKKFFFKFLIVYCFEGCELARN